MSSVDKDFDKYGASYLLSSDAYDRHIVGHDYIGRSDGQFVTPSNQMDEMLKESNGNIRFMEDRLGLPEGRLGENPIRVDIYNPEAYNLRMPDSSLSGANEYFIPGAGKTSGGMSEGVINPFPNPQNHPEVGCISFANNVQEGLSGSINNQPPVVFSGNTPSSGGGSHAPPSKSTEDRPRGGAQTLEGIDASKHTENAQKALSNADNNLSANTAQNAQKAGSSVSGGITP